MIHGERSQSQRTAALTGFQQGRFRILVATDVGRARHSRGRHRAGHQLRSAGNRGKLHPSRRPLRTSGRAGSRVTTLFGMDQRGELLALERTLGIKMERMKRRGSSGTKRPETCLASCSRACDFQNQPAARRVSAGPDDVLTFSPSAGLAASAANKGPADSSAGPLHFHTNNWIFWVPRRAHLPPADAARIGMAWHVAIANIPAIMGPFSGWCHSFGSLDEPNASGRLRPFSASGLCASRAARTQLLSLCRSWLQPRQKMPRVAHSFALLLSQQVFSV